METNQQFVRRSGLKQALALMLGGATMLALAWSARATVTTVAWYELGEADTGSPTPGNGVAGHTSTLDSGPSYPTGQNLTKTIISGGGPVYSTDVSPNSGYYSGGGTVQSTLSMSFNKNGYYSQAAPVSTAITDVGLELWVKPSTATPSGQDWIVWNGSAGANGYGFAENLFSDNLLYFRCPGGQDYVSLGPIVANQWLHLGVVFDSFGTRIYTNGLLDVSFAGKYPTTPTSSFDIGISNPSYSGHAFEGWIDNVRVFTFTDGQFSPNDFLFVVPEPSTMMLFGIGAGLLWLRRRSQRRAA